MKTMLTVLLIVIHCAIAGRKGNRKTLSKGKQRYQKPTDEPTSDPTMKPTISQCPTKYLDPSRDLIEFVFVVDNSCGLSDDECKVQMNEIADTFQQIKVDDGRDLTKVAYIEYCSKGAQTKIGFDDKQYQNDAQKYYDFIVNSAGCGQGGDGKTDAVAGLNKAIDEYLLNGERDCDVKRKIVMFNNCENTDYKYDDKKDREQFDGVMDQLKDTRYFENAPDLMVINVPSQHKAAKNAIRDPFNYLAFLIDGKSARKPSSSQLFAAPVCYLNDDEMTLEDFIRAALVENGDIPNKDDLYRNDDRICQIVGKPNTEIPTEDPTAFPSEYPTEYPTEIPTEDPTEPKKACFVIDHKMKKKMDKPMKGKSMSDKQGKCKPSWTLYKDGSRKAVQFGDFKGYTRCIYIEYPQSEYTLSINKGCGKITWYVEGEECGYFDFDGKYAMKKDFALRCPKNNKYGKW